MKRFFTEKQYKRLLANGVSGYGNHDHVPVVKLFLPDDNGTWLLTGINPEDETEAFGLSDWGDGYPEVGPVSLQTLDDLKGRYRYEVIRALDFEAKFPLSVYAYAAEDLGGIVDRIGARYDITGNKYLNEYYLEEIYRKMYGDQGPALNLE